VAARLDRFGDVFERVEQPVAGGGQPRLGARHLGLRHVIVAHRLLGAARDLVAGQLDEMFERRAADAERHPGEPGRI